MLCNSVLTKPAAFNTLWFIEHTCSQEPSLTKQPAAGGPPTGAKQTSEIHRFMQIVQFLRMKVRKPRDPVF